MELQRRREKSLADKIAKHQEDNRKNHEDPRPHNSDSSYEITRVLIILLKIGMLFLLVCLFRMLLEEGIIHVRREMFGPQKEVC